MKYNIIFLYAELTEYLLWCIEEFLKRNKDFNFIVIQLDNKKTSKYNPKSNYFEIINKSAFKNYFDFKKFIVNKNPSALFVSGRMSLHYLFVSLYFKNKIPVTTCQDSLIENNFKFKFKVLLRNIIYHIFFDNFWGTGEDHAQYARLMGFKGKNIFKGFYVGNRNVFKKKKFKKNAIPKLIFIGRDHSNKNLDFLIKILQKINNASVKITLTVIGINKTTESKYIEYLGFKNSFQINEISSKHDYFILPSKYEPWGVVTHEQLMIGNPVIISDICGSSSLIKNEKNGYIFKNNDSNELERILNSLIKQYPLGYKQLSQNAYNSSKEINFEEWEKTILKLL